MQDITMEARLAELESRLVPGDYHRRTKPDGNRT